MKKVVILGSTGMAGHIMFQYLKQTGRYEVFGVARSDSSFTTKLLDASDFDKLTDYLTEVKPDYVINCIGILVKMSQDDICVAIQMNSYLPHFLAKTGKSLGFKLIHISTDCVFSGKGGGYKEDSFRDGDTPYARTKALGEVINDLDLTVRTSIIGPELKPNGTGLLDWFLKQNGIVTGYSNAFWSGVTTLELAKAVDEMIEQGVTGLYQLCPSEKISKYELLKLFANIWGKDTKVEAYADYKCDKSLVCTRTDFDYLVSGYSEMLSECIQFMIDNNCYPHY